jgi:hypothetical protein
VLLEAVATADNLTADLGAEYRPDAAYPLSVELSEESEPIRFRGIEYTHEPSTISGAMKLSYGTEPQNQTIPFYFATFADKTVAPPLGYVIPAEWAEIHHRLALHGIHFRKLKREVTAEFETYRFSDVSFDPVPYEGRQPAHYLTRPVVETRSLPAGSLFIRLNQRCNAVILSLLEPDAPDSLVAWGFLNPIFEEKEYGEAYVLEKLAAQMLEDNEALRSEFEDRLGEEAFASNPTARLKFFYDRSPYKDPWMSAYPIVRVTSRGQIPEDSQQ